VKFIFYALDPVLPGKTAISGIAIGGDVWGVNREALFVQATGHKTQLKWAA
jgi:hypothetical protein